MEEIIQEQILLEGFFDSLKGIAKEYGQSIMDLFTILRKVLSRKYLTRKLSRRLSTYVENIKENFNNFIQKVIDKVPSLQGMMAKIQGVIQKAFSVVDEIRGGWKRVLVLSGLIVIFSYIQNKFSDIIQHVDGDAAGVRADAEKLYQYVVEKLNLGSVAEKLLSKITDIKSYLGFLGPIVGGVKFVADALSAVTRPFINDYVEDESNVNQTQFADINDN